MEKVIHTPQDEPVTLTPAYGGGRRYDNSQAGSALDARIRERIDVILAQIEKARYGLTPRQILRDPIIDGLYRDADRLVGLLEQKSPGEKPPSLS